MAPLRFRAWHKTLKKVVPVTGLHFFEAVELSSLSFDSATGEQQCWPIDEFIVMQSTGLLDKNGKEIWEGDVLCSESGRPFKVIWMGGGFACDNGANHYPKLPDILDLYREGCEIIGNIHEHPHLLPPQ